MRYAGFSGTLQEVRHRLLRPSKQQRRTRQHGAKVNLQAAVAANVVKRAPDHFGMRLAGADGSRQAGQRVHHHLGPAGGARGEQKPLGGQTLLAGMNARDQRGRTYGMLRRADGGAAEKTAVGDYRIHLGVTHHVGQMLESEVGRIESYAPRQSIGLDQRKRHEELVSRGDQHRASAQILNAGRNRRPLEQIAKGGAMFGADQIARRRRPANIDRIPQAREAIARRSHRSV